MEDLSDIYMIDDNSPFTEGENNEDKNKLSDNYPEIKNDASFFSWYSYFEPQEEKYKIKYNDNEELNTINPCIPIELLISKIYKKSKIDKPWKELYNQFPYFRIINNKDNNGCYRLIMFKKMENIIFSDNLNLLKNYIIDIINNLNEIKEKYEKEFNISINQIKNKLMTIYTILKKKKYCNYRIEAYKKLYLYFNKEKNFDEIMILYLKYITKKDKKKDSNKLKEFLFSNKENLFSSNDDDDDDDKDDYLTANKLNFKLILRKFIPQEKKLVYYPSKIEKNENIKEIYVLKIMRENSQYYYLLFYNKTEYDHFKNYYKDFEIKIENKDINLNFLNNDDLMDKNKNDSQIENNEKIENKENKENLF